MKVTTITNDAGRSFNVRLIRKGDRYGLNDCLVHKEDEPMIEFWDATYENDPKFTIGLGQFVARYALGTLTGKPGCYGRCDHRVVSQGIDLLGYVAEWKITGPNARDAILACERAMACPACDGTGRVQS